MIDAFGRRVFRTALGVGTLAALTSLLAGGAVTACASGEDISQDSIAGGGGAGLAGGSGAEGGAGTIGSAGGAGNGSTGGGANVGGALAGGATGFGGFLPMANGGASPAGGAATSGGVTGAGGDGSSAGGAGPACPDTDGDGANDCVETDDGDPWTDPAIFNGMHVQRGDHCGSTACDELLAWDDVDSCADNDEEKDQYAGWDWDDPDNDICEAAYGFMPNWDNCDITWNARWEGCIHLAGAGPHCFAIDGRTDDACASLFFDGNTGDADAQSGSGVKCFDVPAGDYPLMWFYNMDNGSQSDLHVRYCAAGGAATCTPSVAIPASMLRVECP